MSTSILDRLANGTSEAPRVQAIPDGKGSIDVVPYNANSDPNADAFCSWFWRRLRDDGLIQLYYPEAPDLSYAGFVKLLSGDVHILLVRKLNDAGEVVDVVGFATLELMPFGMAIAAHAGFIFLKEYWDHETSQESARRIEEFWFASEQPKLDVVIGIIAKDNVLARRFLSRIGWEHSGQIPYVHQYAGKRSDASVWYLTRERFGQLKGGH